MAQPLAERMRPKTLDEYIGQKHSGRRRGGAEADD